MAASRDDPIATVWRPKRVFAITNQSTATITAATNTGTGTYPNTFFTPKSSWKLGGTSSRFVPPVTTSAMPVPIPTVPSVVMKELTRILVTISPLTSPKQAPVKIATATPATIPRASVG